MLYLINLPALAVEKLKILASESGFETELLTDSESLPDEITSSDRVATVLEDMETLLQILKKKSHPNGLEVLILLNHEITNQFGYEAVDNLRVSYLSLNELLNLSVIN